MSTRSQEDNSLLQYKTLQSFLGWKGGVIQVQLQYSLAVLALSELFPNG
jgi:hypothetical protein